MRRSNLALLLCGLLAFIGCAPSTHGLPAGDRTFLTGSEQFVIESFVHKPDISPANRPLHNLDRALEALVARAYPPPGRVELISGAMAALCDDYREQMHQNISLAQRDAWLRTAISTNSFTPTLEEMEQPHPQNVNRPRLERAGLRGMLHATGWEAACLANDAEVAEFKTMMQARESPAEERGVLGLNLDRWPVVEVIAGSPAADAGVRNGDVLLQIAGRNVVQVKNAADAVKELAGSPGQSVQLTFGRDGKPFTVEVQRISGAAMMIKVDQAAPGVVYIAIPLLEGSGIADRVKRIIQDRVVAGHAQAVVLDLRGNPGGRPEEANAIADIFLDNKCLEIMQFRNGQRIAFRSHPGNLNVQVILLTDRNTGSAAEMLAMALRDNGRAVIVGQTTAGTLFGKDGEDLGDNQIILFRSEPTVLSPTGKDYSVAGIPPDVPIAVPNEPIKDEALRRAIELAQSARAPVSP